jgi:hypothetical protein
MSQKWDSRIPTKWPLSTSRCMPRQPTHAWEVNSRNWRGIRGFSIIGFQCLDFGFQGPEFLREGGEVIGQGNFERT